MPRRKRARASDAASPQSASQPGTPKPADSEHEKEDEDLVLEPWTDEEEIGLFKGVIRWKPTGIHKHFHLLSLHQYMLSNGYIHPRNEHTRPAGIWRKLQSLYNLDALDEREDSRQLEKVEIPEEYRHSSEDDDDEDSSDDADAYSEAENRIENEDFDLAGADFAERKWQRRLAPDRGRRSESPPLLPDLNFAHDVPFRFTPSFSIEPSEAPTPSSRRGRPRASTAGAARGRPAVSVAAATRRSSRQVGSVAGEEEEEEEEDQDDEGRDDDSDEDESGDNTPSSRKRRRKSGRTSVAETQQTKRRARGR